MSKVNTLPKGLQEFLGNTSQGVNPSDLSGTVSPGIDLYPFWSADKIRNVVSNANIGAVGQFAALQVPAGESRIPIAISADIQIAAGERWRINVHLTDPAGNARSIVCQSDTVTGAATEFVSCSHVWGQNLLIPSGWFFIAFCEAYGGAVRVMSIDFTYVPVKV